MDSNHRRLKSTDLQSVAFDRSATPPYINSDEDKKGTHPFANSIKQIISF